MHIYIHIYCWRILRRSLRAALHPQCGLRVRASDGQGGGAHGPSRSQAVAGRRVGPGGVPPTGI